MALLLLLAYLSPLGSPAEAGANRKRRSPAAARKEAEKSAKSGFYGWIKGFHPFKKTSIFVTAGVAVGPLLAGVKAEPGLVIRGKDSKKPQDVFLQTNVDLSIAGVKRVSSPEPKLRGWEVSVGPRGCNNPVYGDRVNWSILPDVLAISAAREGGLGVNVALPIPGLPYLWCRAPISIYVADPRLSGFSCWVNDKMDRLTAAAGRLAAPVLGPAGRIANKVSKPVVRAANGAVDHVKTWYQKNHPKDEKPAKTAGRHKNDAKRGAGKKHAKTAEPKSLLRKLVSYL